MKPRPSSLVVALGPVLALAALAGCGGPKSTTVAPAPAPAPAPAREVAAAPAPVAVKPRPVYGAFGFDTAGMDRSIAPGADFYRHANGHWLASTPIPGDKSSYDMFTVLYEQSQQRTRAIIEAATGAPGSNGQKIGDYYRTYLDEAAAEAKGIAPVTPQLAEIARITDARGVVLALAARSRLQHGSPFHLFIGQDDRHPDQYIADIVQGGLGLPDRDMYDTKNVQFEPLRTGYKKYAAQMFTLAGFKDADRRAAAVYALEDKIAKTHWTRVQNRDAQKTYNKLTIAELGKLAPAFDWKPWLAVLGLAGQTELLVAEPSAIAASSRLVTSQPVAAWKDYLALHALTDAAPYLSKAFVTAHFEMYGKTLSGTPELAERWKRGTDEVGDVLGEAIGEIYVSKYFTPETKARADQLVKNLLVSMGQRIDGLAWMSAETKAKAREKLATYNPKIGYPKTWRDYAALVVTAGDLLGNAERARQFEYNRNLAKLGKPLDRDEWAMTPMTVNAYYNSTLNEIVFPAAILQPPFFDPNADDAVNYGSIGAVIGHEISHGFDDQGAQYDATGTLKNWWTKDDETKFKAATARLTAQYATYCPFPAADGKPAQCVNGELTLGENIADLAGLTIAFNAYELSLAGAPAPVLDGATGAQRFFLGFAQVWRGKYRDQALAGSLVTDSHSPVEARADTVRNLDPWYAAFGAKPGDALYLPPAQRVQIW